MNRSTSVRIDEYLVTSEVHTVKNHIIFFFFFEVHIVSSSREKKNRMRDNTHSFALIAFVQPRNLIEECKFDGFSRSHQWNEWSTLIQ